MIGVRGDSLIGSAAVPNMSHNADDISCRWQSDFFCLATVKPPLGKPSTLSMNRFALFCPASPCCCSRQSFVLVKPTTSSGFRHRHWLLRTSVTSTWIWSQMAPQSSWTLAVRTLKRFLTMLLLGTGHLTASTARSRFDLPATGSLLAARQSLLLSSFFPNQSAAAFLFRM